MLRTLLCLCALWTLPLSAQQRADSTADNSPKNQDNSFLLEEAYNQEAGIVQHIGTFQTRRGSSDFDFVFTQEWPLKSIRHQLSYDLPVVRNGSATGIGDVDLNYRYQLLGDGNARVAITPRLSVILPTGDWKQSRGNGGVGAEMSGAMSVVLSPLFTTHSNAGLVFTPSARSRAGDKADIYEWSVAQSLIATASSFVQPMLEAVYSRGTEVIAGDQTARVEGFVLSPGVRFAFNFSSGLQVVPGIAVPIGVGPSRGERGVFVYLSFEHPFTH